MPATTRPLFEQIDSWLQEIDNSKTASAKPAKKEKKAEQKKKAISATMGETSHPSEKVDNDTQEAETGERWRENEEDIKKDVPGVSVDETDPKSGGDEDDNMLHIGMNPKATGEDPTHETESVKGDKDDEREGDRGGTSTPMDAEDIGEKYSSMKMPTLLKLAEDKAHAILADIANGVFPGISAQRPAASVSPKTAYAPAPTAATAGYDAAALGLEKDAAEKVAAEFIEQAIRDADLDADLVGSYIHSYYQSRIKQAEGPEDGHEEPDGDEAPPEAGMGGGGPPPGVGGGGDPSGGAGGADMLSALGGGGAPAPGGDMGGGMPPGGDMGGGMPPGGDMGAGGPGGGDQEKALQELAMALQELGINPEELAQMAQGQGAKMASAVKSFQRSGKFRFSEAKTAAQARAREEIKDYIRELTGAR